MKYQITAPVMLVYPGGHPEEEPIQTNVEADSENEAIDEFKRSVHDILVQTGPCESVDFHPVRIGSGGKGEQTSDSPYDIVQL